jgi:hypothetical protein
MRIASQLANMHEAKERGVFLRAFDSALGRLAAGVSAGKISGEEFDQKFMSILNDAVEGKHSRRPAKVRRALAKHDQREP